MHKKMRSYLGKINWRNNIQHKLKWPSKVTKLNDKVKKRALVEVTLSILKITIIKDSNLFREAPIWT
jgi:hypothetical protein